MVVAKKNIKVFKKNYTFFFLSFFSKSDFWKQFYIELYSVSKSYLTKTTILLSDTPYKQYIYISIIPPDICILKENEVHFWIAVNSLFLEVVFSHLPGYLLANISLHETLNFKYHGVEGRK